MAIIDWLQVENSQKGGGKKKEHQEYRTPDPMQSLTHQSILVLLTICEEKKVRDPELRMVEVRNSRLMASASA